MTGEWQPIATAPKDGTDVLVWHRAGGSAVIARFSEPYGCWVTAGAEEFALQDVTHWMPLPPPAGGDAMTSQPIDWRSLLVRYMAHVWDEEGTTFVNRLLEGQRFTAADIAALEEIEREAERLPRDDA